MINRLKLFYNQLTRSIKKDKSISEEVNIIYVYRYLSWALTSFVYLTGKPYSIIFFKLGVIISLFICSKIITDLYIKYRENKAGLRTLVLIESVGITLLLLPTAGMASPFMWYALNPIIVAASYLPSYFCWINLVFYLCSATTMSYIFFNSSNMKMIEMFIDNSNLLLVFILITLAVQLLSNLTKKLHQQTGILIEQSNKIEEINHKLQVSNNQKQESIEHIMSLYQIMEAFNNHSTKDKLFETLAEYTAKLTKSDLSLFYILDTDQNKYTINSNRILDPVEEKEISEILYKIKLDKNKIDKIQKSKLLVNGFLVTPILSTSNYYGLALTQVAEESSVKELDQCIKLVEFLSEFSAVMLERFNLEKIEDHLLIMEEQNRIANEIHDSVSQRLFSISYSIYGLLGKWKTLSKEDLRIYLEEIRESSNLAMQELRNSIYQLSSKKKGERSLEVTLRSFLDSTSRLNGIEIKFDVIGDENLLSLPIKKAITRIIREASGNALRHGQCSNFYIKLEIHKELISLKMVDDGKGFDIEVGYEVNNTGLGLSNMGNLVNSFNGNIEIKSNIGIGTEIDVIIPNEALINTYQGGVAI